jgi:multiple sugar transport system permease protein
VFVMMSVFQVGETFVVLLAGLKSISPALYDAAAMDGASPRQAFWHLTLPLLAPWLILLMLRDAVLSFQSTFTPSMIMTGGDPYYATLFLPLLVYEEAFDNFRLGIGAVMIVFMFIVAGLLVALLFSLLPTTEVDYDA